MSDTSISTDRAPTNGADPAPAETPVPTPQQPRVIWDDSKMATAFANVVNVLSTREELTLLFGTNQTWNAIETGELTVHLSNRVVLTPYAAKRLLLLLTNRIRDYEARYGTLNL